MKVLHVTSELDGGGVERLLLDYYLKLSSFVDFDFVVTSTKKGVLESRLESMGCHVFHIPKIRDGMRKHVKAIRTILNNGHYDIVHDHSGYKAFVSLKEAKRARIQTRIAHSHQARIPESFFHRLLRHFFANITKLYANAFFSCGEEAAKWMWGKRFFKKRHGFIMTNAINVEKFAFDNNKRILIRSKLCLDDKFVIGNIARFVKQKNHKFILDVFEIVCSKRNDAVLLLLGDGELKKDMEEYSRLKGINDRVMFLGVKENANDYYNAMDLFFLPSLFEGLPVTLIEAQSNGLYSIVSSNITDEIDFYGRIEYRCLHDSLTIWADSIVKNINSRKQMNLCGSKYDIEIAYISLLNEYRDLIARFHKNKRVC